MKNNKRVDQPVFAKARTSWSSWDFTLWRLHSTVQVCYFPGFALSPVTFPLTFAHLSPPSLNLPSHSFCFRMTGWPWLIMTTAFPPGFIQASLQLQCLLTTCSLCTSQLKFPREEPEGSGSGLSPLMNFSWVDAQSSHCSPTATIHG